MQTRMTAVRVLRPLLWVVTATSKAKEITRARPRKGTGQLDGIEVKAPQMKKGSWVWSETGNWTRRIGECIRLLCPTLPWRRQHSQWGPYCMLVVKQVSIPRHSDFAAIAGQANDNMWIPLMQLHNHTQCCSAGEMTAVIPELLKAFLCSRTF